MKSHFRHILVLGKYLPPHQGHMGLIRFARGMADKVTVLVEQRPEEAIPVDHRCEWLREATSYEPGIQVVPLYGDWPQAPPADPSQHSGFWDLWRDLIKQHAPDIDGVVSGDDYGARLAHDQDAQWIPLDRMVIPLSATAFKTNPWDRWHWLVPPARRALLRRLVIVGPESTGKTTLAQRLAQSADPTTTFVPEYAEYWLRRNPGHTIDADTLRLFLAGQAASRAGWRGQADRWLIEDSHALTTAIWAKRLGFHDVAAEAMAMAREDKPHHVILASSEGATWIQDAHRLSPHDTIEFEADFREALDTLGWSYDTIKGDWTERGTQAVEIRDNFMNYWRGQGWDAWASSEKTATRAHTYILRF